MRNSGKLMTAVILMLCTTLAKADLVVKSGYVRASVPGTTSTSAYMSLSNTGDAELVITGATTPVAGKVSFHSTMNHAGMMHMMDMDSLKIPAHASVVLESGGLHLMLENTSTVLAAASQVELVLQFADGKKQVLSLPVKSVLDDKH